MFFVIGTLILTLNFLVASRFLRNCHLGQEIVPLSGECALLVQDHMENVKETCDAIPKSTIHVLVCVVHPPTLAFAFWNFAGRTAAVLFSKSPKPNSFSSIQLFGSGFGIWFPSHAPSQCLSLPLGKQTWKQDATSMLFPLPPGPEEKSIHAPSLDTAVGCQLQQLVYPWESNMATGTISSKWRFQWEHRL